MTHGSTRPSVRPTKFFREQSSDHTTVRCCSNVVAKSFYMPFTDRCDLTAKSLGYLRCIKLKPSYQEALVKQLNQNTFISTKPVRSQSKIQEKHLQDLILTSVPCKRIDRKTERTHHSCPPGDDRVELAV